MAMLIGMSGKIQGRTFEVDKDLVTIGRSKDNEIAIDLPSVSGRHCSISCEDNKYTLRDLDSTNGTLLNAVKIKIAQLKPKDIILIGSIEVMFDGEDIAVDEQNLVAATQVLVDNGSPAAPKSFTSISPFGSQKKGGRGSWITTVIWIVAGLAVAGLVALVWALLGS